MFNNSHRLAADKAAQLAAAAANLIEACHCVLCGRGHSLAANMRQHKRDGLIATDTHRLWKRNAKHVHIRTHRHNEISLTQRTCICYAYLCVCVSAWKPYL